MNECSQEDIILRPSESESKSGIIAAIWPLVFCVIVFFSVPDWLEFSGIIYFVATLVLLFSIYQLVVALKTFQPGNTFMRITANGFRYRSPGNSCELSWHAVSRFLVEDDEVLGSDRYTKNIRFIRVQRLYVVTLNGQDKLSIDYTFGYEALDLAVLLSRRMAKSLDLSSYQHLVTVVDMKRGKPI